MTDTKHTSAAFNDSYINMVANLGTARDKAAHGEYTGSVLDNQQLINAYISTWLAERIVDMPAKDATKNWRHWRAEKDQITKIEKLEEKLKLKQTVLSCLTSARLYGGAAIYINTGRTPDKPLSLNEEIKSLVVLTSDELQEGYRVTDLTSEYFNRPEHYKLKSVTGKEANIHASRLVVMRGATLPGDKKHHMVQGWGLSVLNRTLTTVKQFDSTMANIASLVFEAKIDVLRLKGFFDLIATPDGDKLAANRMTAQAAMKGINGAVILDAEDEYDQKNASFAGLPDVVTKFMDVVAGAAQIPVTRLFGRSAAGLSGSGEGDERVYFDRISDIQENILTTSMAKLDELLVAQALGSPNEDIYYEWTPLRQLTEAERAKIFLDTSNAARALAGSTAGELVPLDALSDALVNEFTEQGVLPGLNQAVTEYGSLNEQSEFVGGEYDLNNPDRDGEQE